MEHETSECHREYESLKCNLKRVWELESEEEVRRLTNCRSPTLRTERQRKAENDIIENLQQIHNGQYQTKLLWTTERRPRNNYDEAKKAFLAWGRRLEGDDKSQSEVLFPEIRTVRCRSLRGQQPHEREQG